MGCGSVWIEYMCGIGIGIGVYGAIVEECGV